MPSDKAAVDADKAEARNPKRATGKFTWDGNEYEVRDEPTGAFLEAYEQGRTVAAVRAQLGPQQTAKIGLLEMGSSEISQLIDTMGREVWGVKNR